MLLRIIGIIFGVLVIILAIGWIGFRIPSPSFPTVTAPAAPERLRLPADLPAPVERYARAVFGDTLPAAQTSMVVGKATITINGLSMPARFRFYHDVKRGHYHDIQTTWFGLPIMQVHERYLDGHAIIDIPIIGHTENDPQIDQAANQGLWSEMLAWAPAIVFADPRVRWEAIDADSARMIVPNADEVENFTLRFDPTTGLMTELSTMRYQDGARKRWTNHIIEWRVIDGTQIAVRSSTQWEDNAPWAIWEIEQVILNADVSARLDHFGA